MLQLQNIIKEYTTGGQTVRALNGINLSFRKSEFVAVLGASGCGKTTLLNILGGLDRYTSGDLLIRGRSTREFRASDWDAYRNSCVGFVFQNYNLIPHQTVLGNVELALTLSGISRGETRRRAAEALSKVGLADQLNKKPNQLSGGQMQRVAIARAIVNDPEIILADEPTGALDSRTSVQIADLLAEISKDRLVVMVTHNNELAQKYATRIVYLKDGETVGDSDPYLPESESEAAAPDGRSAAVTDVSGDRVAAETAGIGTAPASGNADGVSKGGSAGRGGKAEKMRLKKTSMKYTTALGLSFRNLITKKGRTFMTSFAGSIGIIGIALVLSISNGFNKYIDKLQRDTLSNYPVTVSSIAMDIESAMNSMQNASSPDYEAFPDGQVIYKYDDTEALSDMYHVNFLSEEYVDYVDGLRSISFGHEQPVVLDIQKVYSVPVNLLTKNIAGKVIAVSVTQENMFSQVSLFQELLSNKDFIDTQYDLLGGTYPSEYNEIALIVDKYNRLSVSTVKALGFNEAAEQFDFESLLGKEYKLVLNDAYYKPTDDGSAFTVADEEDYAAIYDDADNTVTLRLTGILRIKEDAPMALYSSGLAYLPSLTEKFLDDCRSSRIGTAQAAHDDFIYRALIPQSYIDNFPTEQVIAAMKLLPEYAGMTDEQLQALIDAILSADVLPIGVATTLYSANYGMQLSESQTKELALQAAGASSLPQEIYIYPQNFESKAIITEYLDGWNFNDDGSEKESSQQVRYTDAASMLSSTMGQLVDIISYVLIAFAAVSLVVSSIMIAIITYVSVIARTKEIGVLRSIGARSKDITRVFNAETALIGFTAGVFGVVIAFALTFPVSAIIKSLANGMVTTSMAVLSPLHAVGLVIISVALTLVSGLIPAIIAAKRDPVVALRSE